MSGSLAEIIESHEALIEALRAINELYPDAYFDGPNLVAPSLRFADCNEFKVVGDELRIGKLISGKIVLAHQFCAPSLRVVIDQLKQEPGTHARLMEIVTRNGWKP